VTADGTRFLTGADDNTARIWDAKTGTELAIFKGHLGPISSVAVSWDSDRVVTGSDDATARVWDSRAGVEVLTLRGHQGGVGNVAIMPTDGETN